tara:strand:- start:586 stop:741 length:156 start_codon:yes stop_codon:yes gene_type:complete
MIMEIFQKFLKETRWIETILIHYVINLDLPIFGIKKTISGKLENKFTIDNE